MKRSKATAFYAISCLVCCLSAGMTVRQAPFCCAKLIYYKSNNSVFILDWTKLGDSMVF